MKRKSEISDAVAERFRLLADGYANDLALAQQSGIPKSSIGEYRKGRKIPVERAAALCATAGVSLAWLATGRGPMHTIGRNADTGPGEPVSPATPVVESSNGDVLADVVLGLTQRTLKDWAATLASSGEVRKFSARTVGMVVKAIDRVLKITKGAASPEDKEVALIVLCDHFERAGMLNEDTVLARVVRLVA